MPEIYCDGSLYVEDLLGKEEEVSSFQSEGSSISWMSPASAKQHHPRTKQRRDSEIEEMKRLASAFTSQRNKNKLIRSRSREAKELHYELA